MNYTPRAILAFLLMLALVVVAVGWGAYRGFSQDKAQVETALGSLEGVLATRAEMGHNLLVVARRHRQDAPDVLNPLIQAVEKDVGELESRLPLMEKAAASGRLSGDAGALLDALKASPGVLSDDRDLGYVTGLLPRGLEQSAIWADAGQYNKAASEFNSRLNSQLNGQLAKLLGVREAELFAPGGESL